jgi:hypothetical protein
MKGVLLLCLIQFFFHLVVDNYDFLFAHGP